MVTTFRTKHRSVHPVGRFRILLHGHHWISPFYRIFFDVDPQTMLSLNLLRSVTQRHLAVLSDMSTGVKATHRDDLYDDARRILGTTKEKKNIR